MIEDLFSICSYIVIASLCASCSSNKSESNNVMVIPPHELTLEFNLDNESLVYTSYFQLKGKSIYFLNSYNNCIYEYGLNPDEPNDIISKKCLNFDGPNSIGLLKGFYLHNLDTILVIGSDNSKIHFLNSVNKKIDEIDLKGEMEDNPFQIVIDSNRKGFIEKDKLILPISYYNIDRVETINEKPLFFLYNLSTDQSEFKVKFPDIYRGATWNQFLTRPSIEKISTNRFVISFPLENDILVTDFSEFSTIEIESEDVEQGIDSRNHRYLGSGLEMSKNFLKVKSYPQVLFDNRNNILLRTVNIPRKVNNSGIEIIINDKKIYFYDIEKGFEMLKIILIPAESNLSLNNIFIHDGILFIQSINSNSEDKKLFKGFKILSIIK